MTIHAKNCQTDFYVHVCVGGWEGGGGGGRGGGVGGLIIKH